ncbi:GNAT family N-acetyltransferase [Variovorax sp. PAMC26660]|uniref:GNAT family N-acetyltransferase n=1 Tax=Variovorax sp. PAMC26660 TaxID=2762322 RepID=UPI00164E7E24|nr:GNAT family N-acetyltransferase [Variovorax sp. PAMC26660]QNK66508.1 GNAT family N-acetyltransferase [Variovorax sp. PAMC26660]
MTISRTHTAPFELSWCNDPSQAEAIAALFLRQLGAHYISHSELQEQRAVAIGEWRPDLPQVLLAQVRHALAQPLATSTTLVAIARTGDSLAGIALVSIDEAKIASRTFATLDDLVVDSRFQGTGLGTQMFDWLCTELQQRGSARLFLESGIGNEDAHRFFKARGCTPVSVTMLKELKA